MILVIRNQSRRTEEDKNYKLTLTIDSKQIRIWRKIKHEEIWLQNYKFFTYTKIELCDDNKI